MPHQCAHWFAMTSKDCRHCRDLSTRSTQSAWKQCGARHARLNRVKCTIAERFAHSTSEWAKTLPQGIQGAANRGPAKAQRSGFGGERRSPPRGFPPGTVERLSFCPERQNEGCGACDDEACLSPLSFAVQRKMEPPEVAGLVERYVKT